MPEPLDKTGNGVQGSSVDGDGATTPDSGQTDAYLGTFQTKDDANKGWDEAQKTISRLQSEKDKALVQAGRQDELLGKLTALQEANAAAGKPQSQFDMADFKKQWEDGDADFQVNALQSLLAGTASKEEFAQLQSELADAKATLSAQMGNYDPNYIAHQDEVAELKKEFPQLDRETLVKMAVRIDAVRPQAPPADVPPGSSASSRVIEPNAAPQMSQESQAKLDRALRVSTGEGLRENDLK